MEATVEYDGAVLVYDGNKYLYQLPLGLADEYRGNNYPIEDFNNRKVIRFPFGCYYLPVEKKD